MCVCKIVADILFVIKYICFVISEDYIHCEALLNNQMYRVSKRRT